MANYANDNTPYSFSPELDNEDLKTAHISYLNGFSKTKRNRTKA